MREFEIQLSSVQDVQAFVALATTRPFPVQVQDSSHRVNGKSFMEMFCLDFTYAVTACVECSDADAECFAADIARFLVHK